MKSPADDMADYLQTQGHGSRRNASGWCISVGTEPAVPATTITLFDTGGSGPDTDQLDIFNPTFHVRVRSNTYPEGYSKIYAIMQTLVHAPVVTLSGSRYAFIAAETDILSIGKDENDKEIFTANYRALRQ
jgi:hypothetical protein